MRSIMRCQSCMYTMPTTMLAHDTPEETGPQLYSLLLKLLAVLVVQFLIQSNDLIDCSRVMQHRGEQPARGTTWCFQRNKNESGMCWKANQRLRQGFDHPWCVRQLYWQDALWARAQVLIGIQTATPACWTGEWQTWLNGPFPASTPAPVSLEIGSKLAHVSYCPCPSWIEHQRHTWN